MEKIYLACLLTVVVITSGCKKNDVGNLPPGFQKTNCDYSRASLTNKFQSVVLFSKSYDALDRLQKITVHFRSMVTPTIPARPTLAVLYEQRRVIFINESNKDTAAVFELEPSGRISKAQTALFVVPMGWANRHQFSFSYSGNRIKEINTKALPGGTNASDWFPYVSVIYDAGYKNVSKLVFGPSSPYPSTMEYEYDYSRKAKAQVYPDDMLGDYYNSFFFFKDLNIFPELQPENILMGSTITVEYPGKMTRTYTDHKFDADGKLVSYQQLTNNSPLEHWQIDWHCYR